MYVEAELSKLSVDVEQCVCDGGGGPEMQL